MRDESRNTKDSKSMIRFVPSAQQLKLQSSKVQNCQNRGQLLRGCRSTFLIAMGEILSIFMRILGFHRKNLTYLDVWSPFWPRLFLHRGG